MTSSSQPEPLLSVSDLRVSINSADGRLPIIDRADFSIGHEDSLGVVGESGSGKSMLCRALIGTLPRFGAAVAGGSIRFEGRELATAGERAWRSVRGRGIGYIPQSSMAGLNPVLTVGTQLREALRADGAIGRAAERDEAIRYLELVQLPRPADLLRKRSHELSGGMKQRVMIAAALARKPRLLLADEPTTALDVSVQRDILAMLKELRAELGMALILVSHDLAVIEEVCDRVLVMYAGATVEEGDVGRVVTAPAHPYTSALLASRIDVARRGDRLAAIAGEPPLAGNWPTGCRYWTRCADASPACRAGAQPALRDFGDRRTACLRAEELHHAQI